MSNSFSKFKELENILRNGSLDEKRYCFKEILSSLILDIRERLFFPDDDYHQENDISNQINTILNSIRDNIGLTILSWSDIIQEITENLEEISSSDSYTLEESAHADHILFFLDTFEESFEVESNERSINNSSISSGDNVYQAILSISSETLGEYYRDRMSGSVDSGIENSWKIGEGYL